MQKLKAYAKAIYQSFYNTDLYRAVVADWKGFGGQYLLVLSAIVAVLVSIIFAVTLASFEKEQLPTILQQMPSMMIAEGTLQVNAPQPVIVRDKSQKNLIFYIDTRADETDLRKVDGAMVAVGSNFMLIKGKNGLEKKSFASIKRLIIDPIEIQKHWPNAVYVAAALWPLAVFGQFINLLIIAGVVAVCSYVVTAPMREEYNFETRVRIAAIAMTPAILLSKFLLFAFNHNTENWFDILLSVFYFYVMIISTRKKAVQ